MDGESRKIILDANLEWPTALTIDTVVKRLIFAETKLQRVETITYDGLARRTIISKGLVHPLGKCDLSLNGNLPSIVAVNISCQGNNTATDFVKDTQLQI